MARYTVIRDELSAAATSLRMRRLAACNLTLGGALGVMAFQASDAYRNSADPTAQPRLSGLPAVVANRVIEANGRFDLLRLSNARGC
jgi:hypothetical protein